MRGCRDPRGFTLVELVVVIVVLGIVSVGIAGFVRTGTEIYVDVVERDQVLSEGRFVVQRLNREVSNALPNSLRVINDGTVTCLEFVPIMFSAYYFDIPVSPEPVSDEIKMVATPSNTNLYTFESDHSIVVFPTSQSDVYGPTNKRFGLSQAPSEDDEDSLKIIATLDDTVQFSDDSPSSRAYVIDSPVSYCLSNNRIQRYADYGFFEAQQLPSSGGVLMAQFVTNSLTGSAKDLPFRIGEATLARNAFVLTMLRFEINQETAVFNNEVHIPNAP